MHTYMLSFVCVRVEFRGQFKNVENVETGSSLKITFLNGYKNIKNMLNVVSELVEHGVETRSVLGMCRSGTG